MVTIDTGRHTQQRIFIFLSHMQQMGHSMIRAQPHAYSILLHEGTIRFAAIMNSPSTLQHLLFVELGNLMVTPSLIHRELEQQDSRAAR